MSSGILLGRGPTPTSLRLDAANGDYIPNRRPPELPPNVLRTRETVIARMHPRATLRSLSHTYNCIGLVVASRRTWVDPDELHRVFRADDYRQLSGIGEAVSGDVVVYTEGDEVVHAGILIVGAEVLIPGQEVGRRVLSKWGPNGEYEHLLDDVPAGCGSPTQFWTNRSGL